MPGFGAPDGQNLYLPFTATLKIKLYKDAEGRYKGDGLVCYLVKESVDMAINLLDGADFRPGCPLHVSVVRYLHRIGYVLVMRSG